MPEISQSRVAELLKALKSQTLLTQLGIGAENIIRLRTQAGFDIFKHAFTPYSLGYQKKRKKFHRDIWPVDLNWTRDYHGMLAHINHVVATDFSSVRILIDDPIKEQIGQYHQNLGAGKGKVIRKFWGISQQVEKDKLSKIGWDALKSIIQSL